MTGICCPSCRHTQHAGALCSSYGCACTPELAAKDDAGKQGDWHLLPWDAVAEVLRVLQYGCGVKGYAEGSWATVPGRKYRDALQRHVNRQDMGETTDSESGLHHDAHAACDALLRVAVRLRTERGAP